MKRISEKTFKTFLAEGNSVIDYYTTWCPPCKVMAPIVEKVAAETPEVQFAKVNIEESDSESIAAKVGISGIPTFVAYTNGKEVGRREGAMSRSDFKKWVTKTFSKKTD